MSKVSTHDMSPRQGSRLGSAEQELQLVPCGALVGPATVRRLSLRGDAARAGAKAPPSVPRCQRWSSSWLQSHRTIVVMCVVIIIISIIILGSLSPALLM